MQFPIRENADPLRKPDNYKEVFADGEFDDFIQAISTPWTHITTKVLIQERSRFYLRS
ncbi:hypothetical protein H6G14_28985 [Nostoc parmelioides FACHB-3921]|uniref:Uncharacterized protein n=2 Tax=Nostoc TaxID=1177 RepID=A0ABR8BNW6_9NOSO|nr:hypothetical protein [Nostoc parmelioides FACHB-3921]